MGYQTGYKSYITFKLTSTANTCNVAVAPVITSGRMLIRKGNIKEWIKYTGISGNTLTGITRGMSQTADPSTGGTGLEWPVGTEIVLVAMHDQLMDKYEEGDLSAQIADLQNVDLQKVDITDYQNQTPVFNTSTGSANAYVLTLTPALTAYTTGQKFCFKANFANTGSATININGLGAKTINKLGGSTALISNDILNGQIVEISYNGTAFDMVSPVGQVATADVPYNISSFIAGENVTLGDALYVSNGAGGRTAGRVYKASSLLATYSDMANFKGFALSTITTGNTVRVSTDGVVPLTGLTAYVDYYLTDTAGVIGTTPGSNIIKVGNSSSTTSLQIDYYNIDTLLIFFYGTTNTAYNSGSIGTIAGSHYNGSYVEADSITASYKGNFLYSITFSVNVPGLAKPSAQLYKNGVLQEQKDGTYSDSTTYDTLTFAEFTTDINDIISVKVKSIQAQYPSETGGVNVSSFNSKYNLIHNNTLFT